MLGIYFTLSGPDKSEEIKYLLLWFDLSLLCSLNGFQSPYYSSSRSCIRIHPRVSVHTRVDPVLSLTGRWDDGQSHRWSGVTQNTSMVRR